MIHTTTHSRYDTVVHYSLGPLPTARHKPPSSTLFTPLLDHLGASVGDKCGHTVVCHVKWIHP